MTKKTTSDKRRAGQPHAPPGSVDRASEDSFPASDPPSWTASTSGPPAHEDETSARAENARRWNRLRDDIDRGETGDKVAARDPAAAPLGTDAEAAGPVPPPDLSGPREVHGDLTQGKRGLGIGLAVIAIVVVALVVIMSL